MINISIPNFPNSHSVFRTDVEKIIQECIPPKDGEETNDMCKSVYRCKCENDSGCLYIDMSIMVYNADHKGDPKYYEAQIADDGDHRWFTIWEGSCERKDTNLLAQERI